MVLAPGGEFGGDEFGAVVDADLAGQWTAFLELFEHADDALGGQRGVHFDGEDLADAFVEDVERAEA
jgi:hypothetical protein